MGLLMPNLTVMTKAAGNAPKPQGKPTPKVFTTQNTTSTSLSILIYILDQGGVGGGS